MNDTRNVVVVGASAAGLRCACRLQRLKPRWQTTVVEAQPVFSYAACGLPYVLSGDIDDLNALRTTNYGVVRDERFFADEKGVSVLSGWRAAGVKLAEGLLTIKGQNGERQLPWDELVLATGARARELPNQPRHPRVRTFHSWEDLIPLKQGLARGEIDHACVIGAGSVGCELAEAFRSLWGIDVSLIEAASAPLPEVLDPEVGACVTRALEDSGVRVLTEHAVESIQVDSEGVRVHAGREVVTADVAVVAVGVAPNVDLAEELGVDLGRTGAIRVNERLATNVPHVWAAGDCVEVQDAVTGESVFRPLGSLANRQGRALANILAGRDDRFPRVAGAIAVKAFDFNVAAVGCCESRARALGRSVRSVWITGDAAAHYWPEAHVIHLKLVYEPGTQRVLGVQAVGRGEVVKRIDVAAQLLGRGASLTDFAHLEHAYAPPYAPAIDPLAQAAFAAQNQEDGIEAEPPIQRLGEILDVRRPEEREKRSAPSATRVQEATLGELRSDSAAAREPLDMVMCERGTRSAEAVRLLKDSGRRARYLGGGLSWRLAAERKQPDTTEK